MRVELTRRELLIGGLGAAGLAIAGRFAGAALAPTIADRSAMAPAMPVAIQRCESYDPAVVGARMKAALDLIGGIANLVRGKTVTVKINLTGTAQDAVGKPASRTYHVHPAVVAALCSALDAAGAKRITIVECCAYKESMETVVTKACGWDVAAVTAAGGQKVFFENTRNRGTWPSYSRRKVPGAPYLWPAFDFNSHYDKTDVFISVAKLKDHTAAGFTGACKNIFGSIPMALYGDDAPNENSTSAKTKLIHDSEMAVPDGVPEELAKTPPVPADWKPWQSRVPRTVADVLRARSVDLAIIDAVETISGGEGYWADGIVAVQPKLLLVGRNAVCTDAVAMAVIGYDPQAANVHFPFPGENHLHLLAAAGVATIDLRRIAVRGVPIAQALFHYRKVPKVGAAWPTDHIDLATERYAAACARSGLC
jgi:uncharacterized protein (DUF362 family)